MLCKIGELKNKQVISMETGAVLGYIGDVEIDTESGAISHVIIPGKLRAMGFLGREEDFRVEWKNMEVIGDETILVSGAVQYIKEKRKIL